MEAGRDAVLARCIVAALHKVPYPLPDGCRKLFLLAIVLSCGLFWRTLIFTTNLAIAPYENQETSVTLFAFFLASINLNLNATGHLCRLLDWKPALNRFKIIFVGGAHPH